MTLGGEPIEQPRDQEPDRQRADVAEEQARHRLVERREADERAQKRGRDQGLDRVDDADDAETRHRRRDGDHGGDGEPVETVHEVREVDEPQPGHRRQRDLEGERHLGAERPPGRARRRDRRRHRERLQREAAARTGKRAEMSSNRAEKRENAPWRARRRGGPRGQPAAVGDGQCARRYDERPPRPPAMRRPRRRNRVARARRSVAPGVAPHQGKQRHQQTHRHRTRNRKKLHETDHRACGNPPVRALTRPRLYRLVARPATRRGPARRGSRFANPIASW